MGEHDAVAYRSRGVLEQLNAVSIRQLAATLRAARRRAPAAVPRWHAAGDLGPASVKATGVLQRLPRDVRLVTVGLLVCRSFDACRRLH